VDEAADRYAAARHPRAIRAIQKYCRCGDLESQKVETTHGERYLISSGSVDRHIGLGAQTRPLTPGHLDLDVDVAARGVRVGTDFFVRLFREFRELGLR